MDWYIVQYLYPKAFKRFTDVMFPNVGVISLSTLEFYDVKKLYQEIINLEYQIKDIQSSRKIHYTELGMKPFNQQLEDYQEISNEELDNVPLGVRLKYISYNKKTNNLERR